MDGGVTPLTQAPWGAGIESNFASGTWDGVTPIVSSNASHTVTLSRVADPLGGPGFVELHRATPDFSANPQYGGIRAETTWSGSNGPSLSPAIGQPYWFGYAYLLTNPTGMDANSAFIIAQHHTRAGGDTSPDFSHQVWPALNSHHFGTAYSPENPVFDSENQWWAPQSNHQVDLYGVDGGGAGVQPMPAYNTWTRIFCRKVPGYQSSQNPRTQIWMSLNNGPYILIVDSTSPNTYNLTNSGLLPSYLRKGIYYFQTDGTQVWAPWPSTSPIELYMSHLYFQLEVGGVSLYDNCVAALLNPGTT